MSDLVTLDLFSIHHDLSELAQLHRLQMERLDERSITAGTRPAGLRLSIADPVRRVKAALDPFWALNIDDGVGMRGHLLEDYLEVALFHSDYAPLAGARYDAQVPIQWHKHGRSAFDWVVHAGADHVVSCKSSIRGTKPTAANVAQERRMMALAGYPAGSEFEVWVVDPGCFRATGPHVYTLDQEHIDEAREELHRVSMAYGYLSKLDDPTAAPEWNDPAAWREHWGLETTSGAFRYETLDASGAIEARNRMYLRARARLAEAKADEEAAKQLIRQHVEEQLALHPEAKSVIAYSGDCVATYSVDKRGAMRVTEKPIETTADAAA